MYRRYAQPFFSVCVEVDATNLWRRSRASGGPSFFLGTLFLMLRAVNDVEAMRLRLRTLPWLRFTAFTNAMKRADSIPRIVFGKCVLEGRSRRMPVAVEVHHALVDGLDVARLLERFEAGLSSFRP